MPVSQVAKEAIWAGLFLSYGGFGLSLMLSATATDDLYGPVLAKHAIDATEDPRFVMQGGSTSTKTANFVYARIVNTFTSLSNSSPELNPASTVFFLTRAAERVAYLTATGVDAHCPLSPLVYTSQQQKVQADLALNREVQAALSDLEQDMTAILASAGASDFVSKLNRWSRAAAACLPATTPAAFDVESRLGSLNADGDEATRTHRVLKTFLSSTRHLSLMHNARPLFKLHRLLEQLLYGRVRQSESDKPLYMVLKEESANLREHERKAVLATYQEAKAAYNLLHGEWGGAFNAEDCPIEADFPIMGDDTVASLFLPQAAFDEGNILLRLVCKLLDAQNQLLHKLLALRGSSLERYVSTQILDDRLPISLVIADAAQGLALGKEDKGRLEVAMSILRLDPPSVDFDYAVAEAIVLAQFLFGKAQVDTKPAPKAFIYRPEQTTAAHLPMMELDPEQERRLAQALRDCPDAAELLRQLNAASQLVGQGVPLDRSLRHFFEEDANVPLDLWTHLRVEDLQVQHLGSVIELLKQASAQSVFLEQLPPMLRHPLPEGEAERITSELAVLLEAYPDSQDKLRVLEEAIQELMGAQTGCEQHINQSLRQILEWLGLGDEDGNVCVLAAVDSNEVKACHLRDVCKIILEAQLEARSATVRAVADEAKRPSVWPELISTNTTGALPLPPWVKDAQPGDEPGPSGGVAEEKSDRVLSPNRTLRRKDRTTSAGRCLFKALRVNHFLRSIAGRIRRKLGQSVLDRALRAYLRMWLIRRRLSAKRKIVRWIERRHKQSVVEECILTIRCASPLINYDMDAGHTEADDVLSRVLSIKGGEPFSLSNVPDCMPTGKMDGLKKFIFYSTSSKDTTGRKVVIAPEKIDGAYLEANFTEEAKVARAADRSLKAYDLMGCEFAPISTTEDGKPLFPYQIMVKPHESTVITIQRRSWGQDAQVAGESDHPMFSGITDRAPVGGSITDQPVGNGADEALCLSATVHARTTVGQLRRLVSMKTALPVNSILVWSTGGLLLKEDDIAALHTSHGYPLLYSVATDTPRPRVILVTPQGVNAARGPPAFRILEQASVSGLLRALDLMRQIEQLPSSEVQFPQASPLALALLHLPDAEDCAMTVQEARSMWPNGDALQVVDRASAVHLTITAHGYKPLSMIATPKTPVELAKQLWARLRLQEEDPCLDVAISPSAGGAVPVEDTAVTFAHLASTAQDDLRTDLFEHRRVTMHIRLTRSVRIRGPSGKITTSILEGNEATRLQILQSAAPDATEPDGGYAICIDGKEYTGDVIDLTPDQVIDVLRDAGLLRVLVDGQGGSRWHHLAPAGLLSDTRVWWQGEEKHSAIELPTDAALVMLCTASSERGPLTLLSSAPAGVRSVEMKVALPNADRVINLRATPSVMFSEVCTVVCAAAKLCSGCYELEEVAADDTTTVISGDVRVSDLLEGNETNWAGLRLRPKVTGALSVEVLGYGPNQEAIRTRLTLEPGAVLANVLPLFIAVGRLPEDPHHLVLEGKTTQALHPSHQSSNCRLTNVSLDL